MKTPIPPAVAARYRSEGWWRPETLPDRFRTAAGAFGDRVAIVQGKRRLTFAEARVLAERLAGSLRALGVGTGDVVSWQLPNWWEAAVVHHAILLAGAVPNPVNMIFRERELAFVLSQARPKAVFAPESFRGFEHAAALSSLGAPNVIAVRDAAGSFDSFLSTDAPAGGGAAEPPDVALLLYTSGTTSDPKGVLHSHETLLYEISSLAAVHALTPADRYLGGSPVAHVAGLVYGILMPFVLGTSTVLLERWDASLALEAIARDGATFMTGAPAFLAGLAAAANTPLNGFRLFSTGGATIDAAMVAGAERTLGCTVKRAYGSTEVPTLTATAFDDPDDVRLGSDGRVIGAAAMRIVRGDGANAAPGEEGEIWARSPETFLGYLDEALNDGAFTDDGWFRTGDLGIVDETGMLRVTGRLKDIIIRGGENISAAEVEALIATHPAVAECAVVGVPDPAMGERACACVIVRDGAALTLEGLAAHLRSMGIAPQKLPERLEIVAALPHTASGKVAKSELRRSLR